MKRIVLFAGTTEGRKIAEALIGREILCDAFAATGYGASLLPHADNIRVHAGRMDQKAIGQMLDELRPDLAVDATHPYAVAVTENISGACAEKGIPYLRVGRDTHAEGEEACGSVVTVPSAAEAARFLAGTEGNILLTTGSKELGEFLSIPECTSRCFARVLPTPEVIAKTRGLGFSARHVIGMQGPFSEKMNEQMILDLEIRWLVTKQTGAAGGFPEKCAAAAETGCGIVVIGHPEEQPGAVSWEEAVSELLHMCGASPNSPDDTAARADKDPPEAALIGIGPGSAELLTEEALRWIRSADVLIGARRAIQTAIAAREYAEGKDPAAVFESFRPAEMSAYLEAHPEYRRAAVLFTGDIASYSGAYGFRGHLPAGYRVRTISGISSIPYFLAKAGVRTEETEVVSMHGRTLDVVPVVRTHPCVCVLVGKRDAVSGIAEELIRFGYGDVRMTVGENLSYPEERMATGIPQRFAGGEWGPVALVLIQNSRACAESAGFGLEDGRFLRSQKTDGGTSRHVPMTKREVRALALSALHLTRDAAVWDIGAGTGSVSVEAALAAPCGKVYAVEKKPEAVRLLEANRLAFGCSNLEIIEGTAPEALRDLPAPTRVFIGGSTGTLSECVRLVLEKNPEARIVATAVTEETIRELEELEEKVTGIAVTLTELMIVRHEKTGRYHMRKAENPIMLAEITPGAAEQGRCL